MSAQIPAVPPTPPKLVKDNLADLLRSEIIEGGLVPGERIIEGKWAARFNVAQASVREAIHILADEGFVTKKAGRSARVTSFSKDDVDQLYAVRAVLEGLAARLLAGSGRDVATLQVAVDGMVQSVEKRDLNRLLDCDLAFHLRLAELAGNPYLLDHLRRILIPLFAFVRMRVHASGQSAEAWTHDLASHQQILNLLRDRQPAAAEQYIQGAIARYAQMAHVVWEKQIAPARRKKKDAAKALSLALIGGPAYDALAGTLSEFSREAGIEVTLGFSGIHPELNRRLTATRARGYDLVSTHSAWLPSQKTFLAPLDGLLDQEFWADFLPAALDLARADVKLYAVPRNIDVRVLHYRTDMLDEPPANWDAVLEASRRLTKPASDLHGFVFPGRGSGLFGAFYELSAMAGADLFPASGPPDIQNAGGRWALGLLCTFLREGLAPSPLVAWEHDQVHHYFRDGHAAMVGEWPGYYGLLRDAARSTVFDRFAIAPNPAGPGGVSKAYGGGHSLALTLAGADKPQAVSLLRFLTAPDRQILEARNGSVPVRKSVAERVQAEATPEAAQRWRVLDAVITHDLLIPPQLPNLPAIEETVWHGVQAAMTGKWEIDHALAEIAETVVSYQSSVVSKPKDL